jgi:hypothetical protein
MTESKPTTPPGCTLIGYAGMDITGIDYYPKEPVHTGDHSYLTGKCTFSFMKSQLSLPHMHAAPLYLGPVIDLTPVPAVEWVTVGVNSVAMCEGYSLCVTLIAGSYYAELRMKCGKLPAAQDVIPDLPAAQAWAVSKARELARTAKGAK